MSDNGEKNDVMVFIEQNNGKIAPVSIELLCEAYKLSKKLNVDICGVALGKKMEKELAKLSVYGCKKIYYLEDDKFTNFLDIPYGKAISKIIKKVKPQIVLFGATTVGRAVAPRVASKLRCGLTADCTALEIGDYKTKGVEYKNKLLQIRPAFGGNIIATIVSPKSFPSMATVREGVMRVLTLKNSSPVEIIKEKIELDEKDFITEILKIVNEEKTIDLKASKIIVSAGIGAGNPDALNLVQKLAKVLGAELGSSRAMVDSGMLPKIRQVGQTGTTVRPNLYIACGISGQIQHRAGMSESKRIVAINTDKNAPIFKIAHYGIVGNLNDIIPKMIKAYKEKI